MRIAEVAIEGVGGLVDLSLVLPRVPVTALAGANGTGKSKLLACMLAPWTHNIPTPAGDAAEVRVSIELEEFERQALSDLSSEVGWGAVNVPSSFVHITRRTALAGHQVTSDPQAVVLAHFSQQQVFLAARPSLDVLFLPAERRLVAPNSSAIDLGQLSEVLAQATTAAARGSVQNYGRLDDSEFESFAKALSVADQLQADDETADGKESAVQRVSWADFKATIDGLLAPKVLLPLTRNHPDILRIGTPSGATHAVQDLSSGERQALVIVSRILRAGSGHATVLVDEPDAYLHPHLSRRLALALERAVGAEGQLVMATHSSTILDTVPTSSIVRLSHTDTPKFVADEQERLEVYRTVGFRASALTQSDLLMVTEGEFDTTLLPLLLPDLARATLKSAGGRHHVLADVSRLAPFSVPVVGVVDADVLAPEVPNDIQRRVVVWGAGDIEAVILADDESLQVMVDRGLAKTGFASVERLRGILGELLEDQQDNFIAEAAQRLVRSRRQTAWPTPKGQHPIDRLREAVEAMEAPSVEELDECLIEARALWAKHKDAGTLWTIVRGKYVAGSFADQCSQMRTSSALLESISRAQPELSLLSPLRRLLADYLT